MGKTNIYLHLYDFTTCDSVNLYRELYLETQKTYTVKDNLFAGRIFLDQKPSYDFIDLKWDTIVLSLKDLDLPMPETLQMSSWQKSKVRRMFNSNNFYFRIVAHNPNTKKVRPITDVYNLQDETISENFLDLDDKKITRDVQPKQLEVVVADEQLKMTFNDEQMHSCEQVPTAIPKAK